MRSLIYRHSTPIINLALVQLGYHHLPTGPLQKQLWDRHSRSFAVVIFLRALPASEQVRKRMYNHVYIRGIHRVPLQYFYNWRPSCEHAIKLNLDTRGPCVVIGATTDDADGQLANFSTFTFRVPLNVVQLPRSEEPQLLENARSFLLEMVEEKGGRCEFNPVRFVE